MPLPPVYTCANSSHHDHLFFISQKRRERRGKRKRRRGRGKATDSSRRLVKVLIRLEEGERRKEKERKCE